MKIAIKKKKRKRIEQVNTSIAYYTLQRLFAFTVSSDIYSMVFVVIIGILKGI